MKDEKVNEWTNIFEKFLKDEDLKIVCLTCQEEFLEFQKITEHSFRKARITIGAFCKQCNNINSVVKVIEVTANNLTDSTSASAPPASL